MAIPTLTIGPLGGSMSPQQFYMPDGAIGFETPVTVLPTVVEVQIEGTGETWIATGSFTYGASDTWPFLTGTINSIEYENAQGTLLYSLTNLNITVGTYLSYAQPNQNWTGFEQAALGSNGTVFGSGTGDDHFIGFPASLSYTGGGGLNTLDYSSLSGVITINASTDTVTEGNLFSATYSNIQVFDGPQTGGATFVTGPGDETVNFASSNNEVQIGPSSSGPVVLDLRTNALANNGFGGTDVFTAPVSTGFTGLTSSLAYLLSGASSETIIGSTDKHVHLVSSVNSDPTLDYSHALGTVTFNVITYNPPANTNPNVIVVGNPPTQYLYDIQNGSGGQDYIATENGETATIIGSPYGNTFNLAAEQSTGSYYPFNAFSGDSYSYSPLSYIVNGDGGWNVVNLNFASTVATVTHDPNGSTTISVPDGAFYDISATDAISYGSRLSPAVTDLLTNIDVVNFTDKSIRIAPPIISSVSAKSDTGATAITSGHVVTITVSLDEPVTVSGAPTLQLNDGEVATYQGGSGTGSLRFTYTVKAGDISPNLEVAGLNLTAGSSIEDASGNALTNVAGALGLQVNPSTVNELYQAVLHRLPSSAESVAAASEDASVGMGSVIATLVDSSEAQANVYPIAQIVQLATGNMPTTAQLAGWIPFVESNGLLQGQSQTNPLLDQMAEAFVGSTQFGSAYNGGTAVNPNAPITGPIVAAIIKAATGVAATQTQINAWLSTGQTIDQVFVDFALGDQYSAHIQGTVQQYLTSLANQALSSGGLSVSAAITPHDGMTIAQVQEAYQAVVQRAPSSAELNGALSIDSAVGNIGAVAAVVDGTEAKQHVYPVSQIILLATSNLPTASQLAGWVPAVEHGISLDDMALAFVGSTAFGNTYNEGTAVDPNGPITAPIVSAIIQAATGIAATTAQINGWLSTGMTVDQVFVSFALGDQYSAHIQSTVQDYLDATAINAAGLTTIDGINATGALTLGTSATPLTGNNLTILGGSGSLSVVASGNGDSITELNTSTAGGTIVANGASDTINAANGANSITANGAGDHINLGEVSTGTSITAAQVIHASGSGDVITFATTAADATPITWGAVSTVDGGTSAIGIRPDSTVNFGNNAASGSEAIVITGDLTGATTSGGTTTNGIAMVTLGNVVDGAGDQIILNNAPIEELTASSAIDVSAAGSLAQALDMAAAAEASPVVQGKLGMIDWFQYGGNTYVVEAISSAGEPLVALTALRADDAVVKITGLVDLSHESLVGHTLTL